MTFYKCLQKFPTQHFHVHQYVHLLKSEHRNDFMRKWTYKQKNELKYNHIMPANSSYSISFGSFTERNCTIAICLDIRKKKKNEEAGYPLSVRFTIGTKRLYHHIGGNFTKEEFSAICVSKKSGSKRYAEKIKIKEQADKYIKLLRDLNKGEELSLDLVKLAVTGKTNKQEESFLGIWQEIINKKVEEGAYTTGESYECALKSFKKIMGEDRIKGLKITPKDIEEWSNGMKNGVMRDGVLVGKISDTTRGIYLRTCRIIWNECLNRGYLTNVPYPFSNKQEKYKVAIPKNATRKTCHLDVEKMTQLYNIFIEKRYPESWSNHYKEMTHWSLGLFLAQYLCNGFNLADAAELRYDNYYYATNGKAFRFERRKTRSRSGYSSEVIIPIIAPLQKVLDEIAAKPKLNELVFPQILKGFSDPVNFRKQVSLENSNVQDRVIRVCKEILEWELRPSSTWCRHSFANNLKDAGVEREYISESMGHSVGKDVTSIYLDTYPLSKQMEYNSLLLDLSEKKTISDVENMSPEEMKALLVKLLTK